tara:strand:- start:216 stop:428 length:213 start_codon:yes stop_codon:yes gene_type:complete
MSLDNLIKKIPHNIGRKIIPWIIPYFMLRPDYVEPQQPNLEIHAPFEIIPELYANPIPTQKTNLKYLYPK